MQTKVSHIDVVNSHGNDLACYLITLYINTLICAVCSWALCARISRQCLLGWQCCNPCQGVSASSFNEHMVIWPLYLTPNQILHLTPPRALRSRS